MPYLRPPPRRVEDLRVECLTACANEGIFTYSRDLKRRLRGPDRLTITPAGCKAALDIFTRAPGEVRISTGKIARVGPLGRRRPPEGSFHVTLASSHGTDPHPKRHEKSPDSYVLTLV